MHPNGPQLSIRAVRPPLAGLAARGIDTAAALATAGIDPAALDDPEARVPHAAAVRLWRFAEITTGDPDFGLAVGRGIPPGGLGVPEYACRKSPDLRAGLGRIQRYMRLNHDVARVELRDAPRGLHLEHVLPPGRALPRGAVDFVMAATIHMLRDATGRPLAPVEVWVDYPRPESVTALEAFYAAPIRFASGRRGCLFSAADAAAPMIGAEPALCGILDAHARLLLDALPRSESLADRVRALVTEELRGGNPTADHVAGRLGMSARTLQRHLADEGTSHRIILGELRQKLATRYLRDPRLALGEVAFLLGFSEPSAFHRAFKRWSGETPAAFRAHCT